MATLNERLEAEEPESKGMDPVEYEGERKHTEFEKARLEFDPTLPIYIDPYTNAALRTARVTWDSARRSRSRSVPVTCSREARALSEGQP